MNPPKNLAHFVAESTPLCRRMKGGTMTVHTYVRSLSLPHAQSVFAPFWRTGKTAQILVSIIHNPCRMCAQSAEQNARDHKCPSLLLLWETYPNPTIVC